jgi:hypothetical protein
MEKTKENKHKMSKDRNSDLKEINGGMKSDQNECIDILVDSTLEGKDNSI